MREIILSGEDLATFLFDGKIILRDYDFCPMCGSSSVEYNLVIHRHRCLVKECRWTEDEDTLPLRHPLTQRLLTDEEIRYMVLRRLARK